ncbi:uncharacterized protein PAC_17572 [Phialocephala subalpina]|uniref:Uncharacterized protein n=1 Tax=Phialocephala subalpina TaxID=576137 RepID=A0A1L7XRK2_9HELO|nr:uncharacterized protein PAC_17572 [Phialocephala subalpina]
MNQVIIWSIRNDPSATQEEKLNALVGAQLKHKKNMFGYNREDPKELQAARKCAEDMIARDQKAVKQGKGLASIWRKWYERQWSVARADVSEQGGSQRGWTTCSQSQRGGSSRLVGSGTGVGSKGSKSGSAGSSGSRGCGTKLHASSTSRGSQEHFGAIPPLPPPGSRKPSSAQEAALTKEKDGSGAKKTRKESRK